MGFGLQRWIYTMKPRKFLSKRSRTNEDGQGNKLGHEISDYYHYKPNDLENLRQKKYSTEYRKRLGRQIKEERHKQNLFALVSLIITLVVLIPLVIYLLKTFELF